MGSIDQEPLPERILKTDLREYSNRTRHDGPYADDLDLDVLIVGAGKFLSRGHTFEVRNARRAAERPGRSSNMGSEDKFIRLITNNS